MYENVQTVCLLNALIHEVTDTPIGSTRLCPHLRGPSPQVTAPGGRPVVRLRCPPSTCHTGSFTPSEWQFEPACAFLWAISGLMHSSNTFCIRTTLA